MIRRCQLHVTIFRFLCLITRLCDKTILPYIKTSHSVNIFSAFIIDTTLIGASGIMLESSKISSRSWAGFLSLYINIWVPLSIVPYKVNPFMRFPIIQIPCNKMYIWCHQYGIILKEIKNSQIWKRNLYENIFYLKNVTAALAQWVRAEAPQAEGWVFESKLWHAQVLKTGSDSSTAKRSAIDVSVTGPRWWPL